MLLVCLMLPVSVCLYTFDECPRYPPGREGVRPSPTRTNGSADPWSTWPNRDKTRKVKRSNRSRTRR